jgi:hypothetical protein
MPRTTCCESARQFTSFEWFAIQEGSIRSGPRECLPAFILREQLPQVFQPAVRERDGLLVGGSMDPEVRMSALQIPRLDAFARRLQAV